MLSKTVVCAALLMAAILPGCRRTPEVAAQGPPPNVDVVEVSVRDVPVAKEWIGTLDGRVNADIRAQVTGYLLKQNYSEGSAVRKGQMLFEIDPRPFQAALDHAKGNLAQAKGMLQQAKGNLAQSQARLGKADLDVTRYAPLARTKAISQEEMDNAIQSQLEAKAGVEAAQAAIESATANIGAAQAAVYDSEVQLGFTSITSPIDGIAGLAKMQVGALVGPSSGELTTVSTVDPIKAYFTVSEQEYLARHNRIQAGGPGVTPGNLDLILADGSVHPHKGSFFMADRQVDVATGSLRVAALFPNPGNVLRPGQYCRVRSVVETRKNAVLVPQRAISELQGTSQVAVVDNDNKVEIRPVKLGETLGSLRIVEEGLHTGERIVVEGLQKIRGGMTVTPRIAAGQADTR
ncbi:MAG TPA: efflux RND transporter periplasmic adaptor subunit [Bryobacteraceae bacterium]|nr:efflux RND transporter periplasmic adaptor subunit [Bryobacteraceae bacterium]